MSTELEQARLIAERVARRMSASPSSPSSARPHTNVAAELASVRAGLSELQQKLAQLETRLSSGAGEYSTRAAQSSPSETFVPLTHSPWLAGVNANAVHPSQEKFGVEEAVVSELVDFFEKEKQCSVEPGARPCDHCAMCSTRGF